MEPTTSDAFQEVNGHHHRGTNLPIIIVSSVIPACAIIVLFIVVRRVLIRRRIRTNGRHSSIFFISKPIYVLRQRSDKPVPDIERVTNQKVIQKSPSKSNLLKQKRLIERSKNGNKQNFFNVQVFPREPVYRSQQTPSYIVPFTELPANFDFSLANVEVYSDFVIIKDSSILETYWSGSQQIPYLVA